MSTFCGLIEEIPGISVDRFDGQNLHSTAFFLSHCHRDHMEGLSFKFFRQLYETNRKFYCSQISKNFLFSLFRLNDLECSIITEVPLNERVLYDYEYMNEKRVVDVSCVSAGHCPGSIMFVFRANGKSVLYTGDFRINMNDYSKLKPLHSSKLSPESFDKIYLDTTFLNTDFMSLPTRKESSEKMCNIVKQWLNKNPSNVVVLEISAKYGSEYLYIDLSKLLKTKIHVLSNVYDDYSRIEVLKNHVTNDPNSTRIHACMPKRRDRSKLLTCRPDIEKERMLTIIPSVQKWKGKDVKKIYETDATLHQTVNICYSTHASYEELEAFICYFRPKQIFASVCKDTEKKEIYSQLRKIQNSINTSESKKSSQYVINFPNFSSLNTYNDLKSQIVSDEDEI